MRPGVYIPNFNGGEHLARALESLRAQTVEVDVVIVDNGSSDGSDRMVAERFPEVRLLRMEREPRLRDGAEPGGRGAPGRRDRAPQQRRRGGAALRRGAARRARRRGRLGRRGDAAGTRPGADRLRRGRRRPHPDGLRLPARRTGRGGGERPGPLGPTGGAALYRREAFEAVGGFDERIFLYYEDLDLALRLAARGGAAGWRPRRGPCTPTRRGSAPRSPPSTRGPAGAAATCCAATA